MKLVIVGAGIVGITTAYELARDGHQVTVIERRSAAAEEASFANAGVLAPGYVTPWAAPGMPWKVAKQLLSPHAAVRIGLPLQTADLAWMWRFWRACKLETYLAHRAALQKLAFYSRTQLHGITLAHQLAFDRATGYMVLLRSAKDAAMTQPGLHMLRDAGVHFAELDEAAARAIEPALNPDTQFQGAIHLPQDEVGNCRQFALLLKDICRALGVEFRFNTTAQRIEPHDPSDARQATVWVTSQAAPQSGFVSPAAGADLQALHCDGVVLCAATASAQLCSDLGKQLLIRPIYGYSVSAHVREPLNAPRSALMDEHYKVAISRLGARVRVAGSAEIGGYSLAKRASALRTLYKVLHDWFPGAALMGHGVQEWKGARPMFADRPPVIGASGIPHVWLNTGHGSSGWALSCGSARLLADAVAGRAPDIDNAAYQL